MSENITPQSSDTAADLKMKIEKMQAQRSDAKGSTGKPLVYEKVPNSSGPSQEVKANKTKVEGAVPQAIPSPEKRDTKTESPKQSVDLQNWAKSKGIDWTSDTSVLEALRKSDMEFHRKRQVEKSKDVSNMSAPAYQQSFQPPAQVPNPPISLPRQAIGQIARSYNLAPEDAERLIAFNNDFMEAKLNQERARLQKEFDELKKSNAKNDIFRELSSDPAFKNPQVIHEYYRTIEELQERDPRAFDEDPSVYKRAYDQVLINYARRNLQGETLSFERNENSFLPPSTPPRSIGKGGTGEMHRESELSSEDFSRLSVEEQKTILSRMGLISSKY